MGDGLKPFRKNLSSKQLTQQVVGEIVVTDNSDNKSKGSVDVKSKSAKYSSSSRRRVDQAQRAALMHQNLASSNSHILQDELLENTFKRSNSNKNIITHDPQDLLVPEIVKVEKMYLSKDDHEAVDSSSSAVSAE